MPFEDGDFLEIEYSARDAASGELIATTEEKLARDSNIYQKEVQYGPALVVLGTNSIIKGLDRDLRTMGLNELKSFTFKPGEAFGERNEDLVRVMPLSEFRSREIDPHPGMRVNLDNITAIVKSVNSGRVVVDANHPYAGRDIKYDVRIVRHITDDKDKIEALGNSYGSKPTRVSVAQDRVEMLYDDMVKKNADYFIGKANLIASVFGRFKGIKAVEVKEEYLRPKEDKEKKENSP